MIPESSPAPAAPAPVEEGRVSLLVVDDRPEGLMALAALLEPLGQVVVTARSGKEALRHCLSSDFAAILLDVEMPEMDGFETAALIRSRDRSRDAPIIFLSAAYKGEGHVFKGYATGAVDYLLKPIDPDILRSKVGVFVELAKKSAALRALNERLKRQADDLAAANAELESFSYSVSHDLRGPLRAIDGFSQMLARAYAPKLDEQGRDWLGRIGGAVEHMSHLIDALIDLSRTTRRELRLADVDLTEQARAVARGLQHAAPGRTVDFRVDEGVRANGDPALILVLLQNLLSNAWKFTAKKRDAVIEFGRVVEAGHPVYFVRDNGAGFDPAAASRLFQPFQRLHGTEFPGDGIGLATVQRIVHRHGGRVWAEGTPGQGACFYFTL